MMRMWAGWRAEYVAAADDDPIAGLAGSDGKTLFELLRESEEPERETYIVHRGELCFAILNAYPYNSGHLLVLPNRAAARLDELSTDESQHLWRTVTDAVAAVEAAYEPDGVNVGLNMGRAAGAGVPNHLHMHVVPRWNADSNFMTSVAETKVLPEALDRTWERIVAAWPNATS